MNKRTHLELRVCARHLAGYLFFGACPATSPVAAAAPYCARPGARCIAARLATPDSALQLVRCNLQRRPAIVRVPHKMPVKVCVTGCGRIGEQHLRHLVPSRPARPAALVRGRDRIRPLRHQPAGCCPRWRPHSRRMPVVAEEPAAAEPALPATTAAAARTRAKLPGLCGRGRRLEQLPPSSPGRPPGHPPGLGAARVLPAGALERHHRHRVGGLPAQVRLGARHLVR
jgi:hypothetical protein